jgi:hypothetical protein
MYSLVIWNLAMKVFNEQENIGKAKYVVNFHDGVKQHKDGSPFFDIKIFTNKKKKAPFIKSLEEQGYTYGDSSTLTKQTIALSHINLSGIRSILSETTAISTDWINNISTVDFSEVFNAKDNNEINDNAWDLLDNTFHCNGINLLESTGKITLTEQSKSINGFCQ